MNILKNLHKISDTLSKTDSSFCTKDYADGFCGKMVYLNYYFLEFSLPKKKHIKE